MPSFMYDFLQNTFDLLIIPLDGSDYRTTILFQAQLWFHLAITAKIATQLSR